MRTTQRFTDQTQKDFPFELFELDIPHSRLGLTAGYESDFNRQTTQVLDARNWESYQVGPGVVYYWLSVEVDADDSVDVTMPADLTDATVTHILTSARFSSIGTVFAAQATVESGNILRVAVIGGTGTATVSVQFRVVR